MLTNTSDSSYVERMKEIDPNMDIDAFVVQLSTNDATNGMPLGEISDSDEYDDTTIVGAMETIISYVKAPGIVRLYSTQAHILSQMNIRQWWINCLNLKTNGILM